MTGSPLTTSICVGLCLFIAQTSPILFRFGQIISDGTGPEKARMRRRYLHENFLPVASTQGGRPSGPAAGSENYTAGWPGWQTGGTENYTAGEQDSCEDAQEQQCIWYPSSHESVLPSTAFLQGPGPRHAADGMAKRRAIYPATVGSTAPEEQERVRQLNMDMIHSYQQSDDDDDYYDGAGILDDLGVPPDTPIPDDWRTANWGKIS